MKKLLSLFLVGVLSVNVAFAEDAVAPKAPEVKQVCKEFTGKNGKVSKQCKKVKVHKKFEGTKVPTPVKAPAKAPAKKKGKK